jgi:8-oxo-dGTP diphosphatase
MRTAHLYRDSRGKTLGEYPRPSLSVDTAVLTVVDGALHVLLTRSADAVATGSDQWRLPGTFLHEGETLQAAVLRSLREKADIEGLHPRQLHVFDRPGRDDRGWVLTVAHVDTVPAGRITGSQRTRVVPVEALPPLRYDHDEIVAAAVSDLRERYRRIPDPGALLAPGPFVMRDLRTLHEAVLGVRVNPDTFRRGMIAQLTATGQVRTGTRGKPAELFVMRAAPGPV